MFYQNQNLIEIIKLFIENGINVNYKTEYGENALTKLCNHYKKENLIVIIRLLIEKGIDINCENEYGNNALTNLCKNYSHENVIDVITFLIKNGFKVTEKTHNDFQIYYLKKNRDEVLQLLFKQRSYEPANYNECPPVDLSRRRYRLRSGLDGTYLKTEEKEDALYCVINN
jgi:ankyrin repeat protein